MSLVILIPTITATTKPAATDNSSMTFTITHSTVQLPNFTKTTTCSYKPKKPQQVPARDRVIDFGKHRGKMLGTLPSKYLKWVSKNLRAGDTEHWARLADQVLQDPVYNDRLEWEFADSVLNGNKGTNFISESGESATSKLVEISERFGWDNEDKVGWSKVDFGLLGTSKGGRIPRMPFSSEEMKREIGVMRGAVKENDCGKVVLSESEDRRRERRERARLKKEKVGGGCGRGGLVNLGGTVDDGVCDQRMVKKGGEDRTVEIYNPFPGRESLLKSVLDRKRRK